MFETPNVVDGVKFWVKQVKLKVPLTKENGELQYTLDLLDEFQPKEEHVETVCLLSKLHTKQHIEVEIDLDELDATAAKTKATYDEIKAWVWEHYH